jgi:hypothetical protein
MNKHKNKKAYSQVWVFIIIVIAMGLVILIGTFLVKGVNTSVNNNFRIEMLNTLQESIDDMLNENYGASTTITLNIPQEIKKICFVDYDIGNLSTQGSGTYEIRVWKIANEVHPEYRNGNVINPENLFIFTQEDFEMYYIDNIQVESEYGIYCIDPKTMQEFELTSKGKEVLIR